MDQMNDIVLQIMQDYEEKIEELDISMESDFIFEKNREMMKNIEIIDKKYKKKMDNMNKYFLIKTSKMKNEARLKILAKRESLYHEVIKEAKIQFKRHSDPSKSTYRVLLSKLILQGLCAMNENTVFIRCRPMDKNLIQEIIPESISEYFKLSKKKINLHIDNQNKLPDGGFGGVVMTDDRCRMSLNNCLEWKIEDVGKRLIPEMVRKLFLMKSAKDKFDKSSVVIRK